MLEYPNLKLGSIVSYDNSESVHGYLHRQRNWLKCIAYSILLHWTIAVAFSIKKNLVNMHRNKFA